MIDKTPFLSVERWGFLFYTEEAFSDEKERAILNYMAALESANDQLLICLKRCVEFLSQFKTFVPDPDGWQEMLDGFETTLGKDMIVFDGHGTSAHNKRVHWGALRSKFRSEIA